MKYYKYIYIIKNIIAIFIGYLLGSKLNIANNIFHFIAFIVLSLIASYFLTYISQFREISYIIGKKGVFSKIIKKRGLSDKYNELKETIEFNKIYFNKHNYFFRFLIIIIIVGSLNSNLLNKPNKPKDEKIKVSNKVDSIKNIKDLSNNNIYIKYNKNDMLQNIHVKPQVSTANNHLDFYVLNPYTQTRNPILAVQNKSKDDKNVNLNKNSLLSYEVFDSNNKLIYKDDSSVRDYFINETLTSGEYKIIYTKIDDFIKKGNKDYLVKIKLNYDEFKEVSPLLLNIKGEFVGNSLNDNLLSKTINLNYSKNKEVSKKADDLITHMDAKDVYIQQLNQISVKDINLQEYKEQFVTNIIVKEKFENYMSTLINSENVDNKEDGSEDIINENNSLDTNDELIENNKVIYENNLNEEISDVTEVEAKNNIEPSISSELILDENKKAEIYNELQETVSKEDVDDYLNKDISLMQSIDMLNDLLIYKEKQVNINYDNIKNENLEKKLTLEDLVVLLDKVINNNKSFDIKDVNKNLVELIINDNIFNISINNKNNNMSFDNLFETIDVLKGDVYK